ncbi:MAG: FHA domain-containing protein [Anaeromyxobacteraceae bacterium]|nr:FHA domain-containing protein [Anaeromyxobacteraceae bacterium]
MVVLVVLNGSRAGARFVLADVPAVVGRSPEAHLRIDDPWISNLHALFELRGAALWVVDLDSRNGTFVGDARVGEAQVQLGEVLVFGRTEVRIEPPGLGEGRDAPPARTPARFDPTTLTTRAARPDFGDADTEPATPGAPATSGDAD